MSEPHQKGVRFTKRGEIEVNRLLLKHLLTVLSSSLLVACAAPGEPSDRALDPTVSRGRDCISQSSIRDYQVLDDSNLIVTASARRKYHVALNRRAFGLRSTWQIGFSSSIGRICPNSGKLIINDGFGMMDRIGIASIREIGPDEVEELLVRFGKKEPEIEQNPATEDIEGAEVEELD